MSELPYGWEVARLPDVCELNPGKPDASRFTLDTQVTFVPMAAVDADLGRITNPTVRPFADVSKGFTAFQENDVILAKITPCMENGKAAIARGLRNGIGFGSTEFHVFRSSNAILPEYLFYFIRQDSFRKSAEAKMTGSVGQKRVPVDFLKETILPLPPFNEQRRIVEKLEKLLSRVDAAQARLSSIPRILQRFRQSVLAAACSGRLTAEWREQANERLCHPIDLQQLEAERRAINAKINKQEGVKTFTYKPSAKIDIGNKSKGIDELFELPSSWHWVSLGQVTWDVADGPHFSPKYVDRHSGIPFISGRNISYKGIDFSDAKYVCEGDHAEFIKRAKPMRRDVLLTKGGTTGIATIVDTDEAFSIWVHVALLKVIEKFVSPYYLRDALSSSFVYKQSQEQTHGVGNQDLGLTRMVYMALPLPPLAEQQEIVRRVEALFKPADALEARYRKAKAHVDKLKQSILAKAFRGELVLQDPNDEPASVLLERIQKGRNGNSAKKVRRSK